MPAFDCVRLYNLALERPEDAPYSAEYYGENISGFFTTSAKSLYEVGELENANWLIFPNHFLTHTYSRPQDNSKDLSITPSHFDKAKGEIQKYKDNAQEYLNHLEKNPQDANISETKTAVNSLLTLMNYATLALIELSRIKYDMTDHSISSLLVCWYSNFTQSRYRLSYIDELLRTAGNHQEINAVFQKIEPYINNVIIPFMDRFK